MLPFIFEWHWDLAHFIFMGLFYMCLAFIVGGLHVVVGKALWDFISGIDHKPH